MQNPCSPGFNISYIMYALVRQIFFYFLVYGSSDPNFGILEKKKIFSTFFLFSPMKKTARFKKNILNIKKKINKNCM